MKKEFNLEELKNYIESNGFKEGEKIYCKQYPNLLFIYEPNQDLSEMDQFVAYYSDNNDLFADGALLEFIEEQDNYLFSKEPYQLSPKDLSIE